jgi:hypothetical protein
MIQCLLKSSYCLMALLRKAEVTLRKREYVIECMYFNNQTCFFNDTGSFNKHKLLFDYSFQRFYQSEMTQMSNK